MFKQMFVFFYKKKDQNIVMKNLHDKSYSDNVNVPLLFSFHDIVQFIHDDKKNLHVRHVILHKNIFYLKHILKLS